MKRRIFVRVTVVIIVIWSVFGVREYIEKRRYESYLSLQVTNDIANLYSSVANNQRIYADLLDTKTISLEQVEKLHNNNYEIVRMTQEYKNLATQLNRVDGDELENLPANNASSIAYFFERLIWDIAEQEGVSDENRTFHLPYGLASKTYQLGEEELKKIEKVQQLNSVWLSSIAENANGIAGDSGLITDAYFDTYRDTAITSAYWVNVVKSMDVQTNEFLVDHSYIENIRVILY